MHTIGTLAARDDASDDFMRLVAKTVTEILPRDEGLDLVKQEESSKPRDARADWPHEGRRARCQELDPMDRPARDRSIAG